MKTGGIIKEIFNRRRILVLVLVFAGGCVLGYILGSAYGVKTISKMMYLLQEKEIFRVGEAAEDAYYEQPNEVALWALENYIKTLNEIKEERGDAGVEDPYFVLSPDKEIAFAHIRIGKLYEEMGEPEKSQEHFEQAISYSKEYKKFNLNTREDCLKMLDALDKTHRAILEERENAGGNDE